MGLMITVGELKKIERDKNKIVFPLYKKDYLYLRMLYNTR